MSLGKLDDTGFKYLLLNLLKLSSDHELYNSPMFFFSYTHTNATILSQGMHIDSLLLSY